MGGGWQLQQCRDLQPPLGYRVNVESTTCILRIMQAMRFLHSSMLARLAPALEAATADWVLIHNN
jgi:hypothetical protein